MEISSLRWSTNFLQRENSRNAKIEKPSQQESRHGQIIFQVPEAGDLPINFSAITPRDLRALALENYQAGKIDQDTYITLSEELPTHAVDAQGQVVDLSQVTDETDSTSTIFTETSSRSRYRLGMRTAPTSCAPSLPSSKSEGRQPYARRTPKRFGAECQSACSANPMNSSPESRTIALSCLR
jgi:hypothetical protein